MSRHLVRAAVAVSLISVALVGSAQEKPTRVAIGKRAKAATAFVDVPGRGTGTAFCVHPSGLFVTNEHVVRGAAKDEVTLVLDPSLDTQRVLKAKVVRADKDLDLALLRVDGAKGLPSLPLGSTRDVAELADVVACGFPLGKALSPDRTDYPAVSVNAGTVTALRTKGGELQSLQIDVALTYGNSGGPVLDDTGKVVGVVVSGFGGGKGINQAIPVGRLDRFLRAPDVAFAAPELTRANLAVATEFRAGVVSFAPDAPEPSLKLVLQSGDGEARVFPMTKAGGVWTATATPVVKTAARVELTARLGSGSVTGTAADAVITVGGRPVRLSAVKRIDLSPKPGAVLADGRTTIEGAIGGLGAVEFDVGGQKVKLDLSKAAQVGVQAAPEVVAVNAAVVATVDGKEVARAEARIVVRDANTLAPADPTTVVITPPALAEDRVVKKLPEVFADVAVGGGGRYLIFHMPKLKKLAAFDVNEARVTRYIPLAEEDIVYAAGLDCVVIGLKKGGKLERWSLTTFELEKSAAPPFKEDVKGVVLGSASNGPLVVNGYFLDLATFRQLPILDANRNARVWEDRARPNAAADGSVFGLAGTDAHVYVTQGNTVREYQEASQGHLVPGPDGRRIYSGNGVHSQTLKRADRDDGKLGFCLPAVRGDYFLSLTWATEGRGGAFTVYLRGLSESIAKLDKAEHGLQYDGGPIGSWRRVYFVPDAKVIAVLPASNDQVVLHKFDADAALEKSGANYLLVTSQPPKEAKPGSAFAYPVKVKAKDKRVAFQLDSGPKGMAVSADGVVTWAVPADAAPGDHDAILTVRDGTGQEVFHTFAVKVVK